VGPNVDLDKLFSIPQDTSTKSQLRRREKQVDEKPFSEADRDVIKDNFCDFPDFDL